MAGRVSYYGGIVRNGLVLHLDAAKKDSYPKSGTSWSDLSGNVNNGTLVGPTYNNLNGGSLTFNGVNNYVNVAFGSNFPTSSSPRTLCAFFNATTVSGGREIFGIGGNSFVGNRSSLWIDSSNAIGVECQGNGVVTSTWSGINNWVYLCVVLPSGSTNVHSFVVYTNGVLRSSTALGSNSTLNSSNSQCVIGTVPASNTSHMFSGNISIIQLYNRDLSATEVLQNYNALKGRYGL
jgi:hypothetical protein